MSTSNEWICKKTNNMKILDVLVINSSNQYEENDIWLKVIQM